MPALTCAHPCPAVVQVEQVRQEGPEAFTALLTSKLAEAASKGDAPIGWVWCGCDACGQWRLLSHGAALASGIMLPDLSGVDPAARFVCGENGMDRPDGVGCAEPPEWVEAGG